MYKTNLQKHTLLRSDVRIFSRSSRVGIRSFGVPSSSFSRFWKPRFSRMWRKIAFSSRMFSW